MLKRIGSTDNILPFLEGVKQGNERLIGFGHRVYKNYDPRARIIRGHVDEVLEATSKQSSLLDVAMELEKRALDDEYFTSRKLFPNVDYWSGIIYEAMGLPSDSFTVMFAIGRTPGWMAQWMEMMNDPEFKIARPRQIYTGARDVDYVPMDTR
jgi:citrate synthase